MYMPSSNISFHPRIFRVTFVVGTWRKTLQYTALLKLMDAYNILLTPIGDYVMYRYNIRDRGPHDIDVYYNISPTQYCRSV